MFLPYRDDNPRVLIPYVTYTVLGLNCLAFVLQNMGGTQFTTAFAIIPKMASVDFGFYIITLFTSMILHGGLMHLGGNMLYLWIFADNVEGILGHTKFAVFYLTCGVAAGILQTVIDPMSTIPIVGASGAIAGVLGAYMITFPRARVHTLIFLFIYFTRIRIPAVYVLGFWFLVQLSSGLAMLGIDTTGGVAWFAHIGGFLAGIALIRVLKLIRLEMI